MESDIYFMRSMVEYDAGAVNLMLAMDDVVVFYFAILVIECCHLNTVLSSLQFPATI